ncbi:glycosyltransferase family 4 protein [Candidatus Peregrinibacteria bacterium]|nr:glycosyltransferase family 4 protein [Candidatus Peregrinibacteria bacterium]
MKNTPNVLFITRKWHGWGGMQQLSKDLWQCMENEYEKCAVLCVLPKLRWWVGRDVHLGDAALVPIGWALKKLGAARVTVTVCGLDVIWSPQWYQWILKKTLPSMNHVVCISNATAEEVRRRGVPEKKISVIPCGIWEKSEVHPSVSSKNIHTHVILRCIANFFMMLRGSANASHLSMTCSNASKDHGNEYSLIQNPILLTVGRLVKRKGHVWFVENVLPFLVLKYSRLEYWIIGEGPERKRIESIIRKYRLESHVRLLGSVSDRLREEYYRKADIFVMPNIPIRGDMEGFGIACIEASSRGVSVVAARLEGLQDAVIEGETGVFFESGNGEDCMTAIQRILKAPPPLGGDTGGGSREIIKQETLRHFSWPRLFQRYRDEVFRF